MNTKEEETKEIYRIVVFDILQWFELKLSEKYAHSVYSVFHKLKSVLLLLKSIRASLYDLSIDEQNSVHRTQLDSIVHMIHSLIEGFPLVIDYHYLIGFSKGNIDVLNIILSNLKVMEQHDGNTLIQKTQQLHSQIKMLCGHVSLLNQAIEETAPVLKRLALLKSVIKSPLEVFMIDFQKLQSQNSLLDDAQLYYSKYIDSCNKYNDLLNDPLIVKSTQQKEMAERLMLNMNSMLHPFISDIAGIRNKLAESTIPEHQNLSAYLNSILFPSFFQSRRNSIESIDGVSLLDSATMVSFHKFYDSLISSEDFIWCFETLAFATDWSTFGKKKRVPLVELARDFDRANFAANYKEYVAVMKQLHKTENDSVYKHKINALKEICADTVNSQKIARKYRDEYQKCTEIYERWISIGNEVKYVVHECCLEEFNLNVEVLIPQLYLTPRES